MQESSTAPIGVLAIDKSAGPTSHDVIAHLRRITRIKRLGHTGTLDPFASGLLLVAVGPATRLADFNHQVTKTYEATIQLGAASTTDDPLGTITHTANVTPPTQADIEKILPQFTGLITQVPPTFAAIKVQGRKLYEYARAGEQVERVARQVTIHALNITSYQYPQLSLSITCSSGTYIRALARDIGAALFCGAYVTTLRRTAIGNIKVAEAKPLAALTQENWQEHLLPPRKLVEHLAAVTLSDENVAQWRQGRGVQIPELSTDALVTVFAASGQLQGIGKADAAKALLLPHRVL